jgi:lipoate-protein ligase A
VSALDVIVAPSLAPEVLLGLELHFLEAVVTRASAPVLIIHSSMGRYLSIGRYDLYGGPAEREGLSLYRRLTGGRVVGAGEGWLGIALILPTRSSLLKEEAAALKPDQVMNRYARGLLAGLRSLKLNCFYPGRDAITCKSREIAMCTYETDRSDAMLFEATLAVNRGMEEVVHDLERIDPEGELSCAMYGPESATKVIRELERDVRFEELAEEIAAGYGFLLGEIRRRDLSSDELAQGTHRGRALADAGWRIRGDNRRPGGKRLANRMAAQLGAVEARVCVTSDGTIESAMLSGDLIANSRTIAELESELCGKPLELAAIAHAVTRTLARPGNFILGIGELSNLVRLFAEVN